MCHRLPLKLNMFGKLFEESGSLGKGITVGKVQVALSTMDRSSSSIFGMIEKSARENSNNVGKLSNDVCLAVLRRRDDWVAACSDSKWFSQNDAGQAERYFSDWSNREASKFEKEYIPGEDSVEVPGGPSNIVISLILEIRGDSTEFEGAGFSVTGTEKVLSSIAADCSFDDSAEVNAAEIFWTPSERDEVMTTRDMIYDFPELITL